MRSRYFHHLSTNKFRIVSTVPQHGQEDGEEMGKRPFDITINYYQTIDMELEIVREEKRCCC